MIKCSSFLVSLTIALWPQSSEGQEKFLVPVTCYSSVYLEKHLRETFGENPIGLGSAGDRTNVELWLSENGESWSFLFRPVRDTLCIVATGAEWREVVNGIPIRGRGD